MSIETALKTYHDLAVQGVDYRVETAIGAAEIPVVGGFGANVKSIGNSISLPFKVLDSLVTGKEYSVDKQHDIEAMIPTDIKDTPYAKGLKDMDQYGENSAAMRTKAVGALMHGKFKDYFREQHVAQYNDNQMRRVIMPGEGKGPIDNVINAGLDAGFKVMISSLAANNASSSSLGGLPAPAFPLNTGDIHTAKAA